MVTRRKFIRFCNRVTLQRTAARKCFALKGNEQQSRLGF